MNSPHPLDPCRPPHVVFAGGSSGGHLFPGLAVAERIKAMRPEVRITFAGSGRSWERTQVAAAGYPYISIPCRPLPRRVWHAFRFLTDNLAGLVAARWFLREQSVSLAVGLGSYGSVPLMRAAMQQRLPTLLLEANAVPGRATQFLAPTASLVCGAFAEAELRLGPQVCYALTGTPLRRAFNAPRPSRASESPHRARTLVVLGGSNGSQLLNEAVPPAIAQVRDALDGWQIIHQAGAGGVASTQASYGAKQINALVFSFIDHLPDVLREADLVVCRAGGSTLAEIAACGAPAILIPYALAADQHQLANARAFAAAGACERIEEGDGRASLIDQLSTSLSRLARGASLRRAIAQRLAPFARPAAASDVAERVLALLDRDSLPHSAAA